MMQNVWNDYVTTADGVYVSATEADAYITYLEAIVDAESVRRLYETDPRPMTPAGLVHVSGTVTLSQWAAIRRFQQATLTPEQEQDDE